MLRIPIPCPMMNVRCLLTAWIIMGILSIIPDRCFGKDPIDPLPLSSRADDSGDLSSPENIETQFDPIILKAAYRYGVDPALIKAIIKVESRYDPKAKSPRGAKGLMQIMPRTAKSLGIKKPYHPEHNIYGGTRFFRQLLDQLDGDVRLALAAYNAGITTVRQHEGIPPVKETEDYIQKVLRHYHMYKSEMLALAEIVESG